MTLIGSNKQKSGTLTAPLLFYHSSAEDEGFKPPIPGKGYTGFRVQRIRSLCQSSFCRSKRYVFRIFVDAKVIIIFEKTSPFHYFFLQHQSRILPFLNTISQNPALNNNIM